MRIIQLQAENIKRLKAVDITPGDGNTVIIQGRNGQGKTSVLDAIWFALAGGEAGKEIPRPIREGEKSGFVRLDLGDYTVTRHWTDPDKSYIRVEGRDGKRIQPPQTMLNEMIGELSFDPLAFASAHPKDQLKTLLDVVKLEIDPVDLEAQRKAIFDDRTLVHREVKQLDGQLAGMDKGTSGDEISVSAITAELQEAANRLTSNNTKRGDLDRIRKDVVGVNEEIDRLTREINRLLRELKEAEGRKQGIVAQGQTLTAEIAALVDPDLTSIQARLDSIEETNQKVRAAKDYADTQARLEAKKAEADKLTGQIGDIDARKAEAIAKADMPVEGLGFDTDGVTFNNIPFSQASSSEQLRVSLAMAMSLNPTLRVIRIQDGSLLDDDSMAAITEMARERDYQIWVERVGTGGVGIVIEDGEVAASQIPQTVIHA